MFRMSRFLTAVILIAGLLLQSCSKKSGMDSGPEPIDPVETGNLKAIPDSMFRAYLKANVCPNAFDQTGKFIDITHSEVKNFTGTMTIDTFTCPRPFVSSLRGVEYFSKMKKLIVKNSAVDSLNLTQTMELDTIKLVINKDLQYLALSGCTRMRYIRVADAPAKSLNLSNLPELNYINLINLGRLNELKTDNDAKLQHLMTVGLSSLKTVNVSTNPALRRLNLEFSTVLNALDLTHNPKLFQIVATFCPSLKSIDLSKNDSLRIVQLDQSGIESIDFSHNPELFSIAMFYTPLKDLSLLANPKVQLLWLDGCTQLKTLDLRAQKKFEFYYIDNSKYQGIGDDDKNQILLNGNVSPVPTAQHTIYSPATRAGVNGATMNLYGGLRVPQYLDANGLSLTQIKLNDAVKDNYSLEMARRVLGNTTPVQITVYGDDQNTILCNDYDPKLFKCN
jgi:hypothetical protein